MTKTELRNGKKLGFSFEFGKTQKYIFGDTVDELIDNLALLKDGKFINEFVFRFPLLTEEQLERLDAIILDCKNPDEIAKYASSRKTISNREETENTLISLRHTTSGCTAIVKFAKYVNGADIVKFQDSMSDCFDNPRALLDFLSEVPGADPYKFKKPITDSNNIFETFRFYSDYQDFPDIFSNEELEELQQKFINSGNSFYIYLFARNIKGADIDKLRTAMLSLSYHDEHFYNFIKQFGLGITKAVKKSHFFSRKNK